VGRASETRRTNVEESQGFVLARNRAPKLVLVVSSPRRALSLRKHLATAGFESENLVLGDGAGERIAAAGACAMLVTAEDAIVQLIAHLGLSRASGHTTSSPVLAVLRPPEIGRIAALRAVGVSDFILSPIVAEELRARLESLLAGRWRGPDVDLTKQELSTLVDVFRDISATVDGDHVLGAVVRKLAEITGADRCSLVLIESGSKNGYVLATFENPNLKDLVIDLDRYPEILEVLRVRDAVAIAELSTHPLSWEVRDQVRGLGRASVLVVPVLWEETGIGTMLVHLRRAKPPFSEGEVAFCRLVAHASRHAIRNASIFRALTEEKDRLTKLVITDGLTGVFSRAYLEARLEEEFERARRHSSPFSLIMLDVDSFKRVNDTFGHLVGDHVLKELAAAMRSVTRRTDLIGRYGGEEFAILLPGTEIEGAVREAHRICSTVATSRFVGLAPGHSLTVSIGVACSSHRDVKQPRDLVAHADEALYAAKRGGKNRVCRFE